MPGPGGGPRGGGGPGRYGGGPRGGIRGPPMAPPPPAARAGMFFGGPGLRGGGGRPRGPMGTSCCCWVWLCAVTFVVLASVGVTLIEALDRCTESTDQDDEEMVSGDASFITSIMAFALSDFGWFCCCVCREGGEARCSDGVLRGRGIGT